MPWKFQIGITALLFATLACEPVLAIGWCELSCIFLLMALLFGPPVYRFLRRLEEFRKAKNK